MPVRRAPRCDQGVHDSCVVHHDILTNLANTPPRPNPTPPKAPCSSSLSKSCICRIGGHGIARYARLFFPVRHVFTRRVFLSSVTFSRHPSPRGVARRVVPPAFGGECPGFPEHGPPVCRANSYACHAVCIRAITRAVPWASHPAHCFRASPTASMPTIIPPPTRDNLDESNDSALLFENYLGRDSCLVHELYL